MMTKASVTLKDIAQRAGVSVGTAHNALYGKKGVSKVSREKILKIVAETNYSINGAASLLKKPASNVTVVLPAPQKEDKYYFRGIWQSVREAAKGLERYKIHFNFIESPYSLDNMASSLEELYDDPNLNIDSLITIADRPKANEWVTRFSRRGIPVFLISSYEKEAECMASARADNCISGELAADYLAACTQLARGKKGKILLLSGHSNIYSNRVTAQSFEQRLLTDRKDIEILKVPGFGRKKLEGPCIRILQEENLAGIFTCNARNTKFMCDLLRVIPKKSNPVFVGTDVFNEMASCFEDRIINASVYQSNREQGKAAVDAMFQHLEGQDIVHKDIILPPILVFRSNYQFFSS
jgi:LacI family transcriptional regulator